MDVHAGGGGPRRRFMVAVGAAAAMLVAGGSSRLRADAFHGLNAGAPVWNGQVIFTPQKAAAFAATGTGAVRINFRLDAGATSWTSAQLALYDQVIANARGAGLDVLGLFSNETTFGGQAAWNVDPAGTGMNDYVAAFADNAELLVDRYKDDVKQWEVWNEPNAWTNPSYQSNPQQAGGTYILPRVYGRMFSETYRRLNTGTASLLDDFGISLASGGLLAHDIGNSFSTAMDYMQQVYNQTSIWNSLQADAGVRYPWQDFGYHFYLSQGSLVSSAQLASYFNAVRNAQSANNDLSDIVVTEFGWQTVGTNTEELQRDNMATAYDHLESRSDVSGTYWYQWTDDSTGAWGLVHGNGAPKLAYHEFAARNQAASRVTFTTHHALNDSGLPLAMSSSDLLQGKIPVERPGDLGWHSANPAAGNSLNPNGLPAFTDGVGDLGSGVTGLLNDFPASGAPAKSIEYALDGPSRLDEIRVFTGNAGRDGRIFSTTAVWTSTDGEQFDLLGYFQSDPSGATNNSGTVGGPQGATVVRILRPDGKALAEDVTHVRFELFAVADLGGLMRDPFDGLNSYTGADDGLSRAYVSPLVREIDVLGAANAPSADFNGDLVVDGGDFLRWQRGLSLAASAQRADGDANYDGLVDGADLAVWRAQFGNTPSATALPEPTGRSVLVVTAALFRALPKRRSRV